MKEELSAGSVNEPIGPLQGGADWIDWRCLGQRELNPIGGGRGTRKKQEGQQA